MECIACAYARIRTQDMRNVFKFKSLEQFIKIATVCCYSINTIARTHTQSIPSAKKLVHNQSPTIFTDMSIDSNKIVIASGAASLYLWANYTFTVMKKGKQITSDHSHTALTPLCFPLREQLQVTPTSDKESQLQLPPHRHAWSSFF